MSNFLTEEKFNIIKTIMDLMELRARQNFLTIRKNEYNHHLGRNVERVFRMFDKKTDLLPPTIDYIFNKPGTSILQPIEKTLGLVSKPSTKEMQEKFAENIRIQKEVLRVIKKRNEAFNYRCGLIKLTTGKGKSHIIMDITEYYQTNTLILCHNVKTLTEMVEKFETYTNIKPAQYGGGKKEIGNITIMTKKGFSMDYDHINASVFHNFNLVLIDEAPVGFSKAFWNGLNSFFGGKSGIALYGLSGTPQKIELDQSDLERYFGKVIEVKNQAQNGYNIIPDFTMYDYIVDKFKYEYENPAEMRTEVSENFERLEDQIIQIKELFKDRKCLLILTDRKIEVENFYNNKDFGFTFTMTGETKIEDDNKNIESAKKLVKAGKRVCIIGTIQKCGIGVDIPMIDTIFLASAIKFQSAVIQAIGRGLRVFTGKNNVKVGVWNDLPHYRSQKTEKLKVIQEEYGIELEKVKLIKIIRKRKKIF